MVPLFTLESVQSNATDLQVGASVVSTEDRVSRKGGSRFLGKSEAMTRGRIGRRMSKAS